MCVFLFSNGCHRPYVNESMAVPQHVCNPSFVHGTRVDTENMIKTYLIWLITNKYDGFNVSLVSENNNRPT